MNLAIRGEDGDGRISVHVLNLRDRLIADGIASVESSDMAAHEKRGSLAGFRMCRTLEGPDQFEAALEKSRRDERAMRDEVDAGRATIQDYWELRYASIQVEFVHERLKIVWGIYPQSAGASIHVGRLLGVLDPEPPP